MNCAPDRTLIIGYGNVLRGDDSAGVRAATALREAGVPALDVHQLVPELAEAVAAAERVIFIDADAALAPGEVRVTPVTPESGSVLEHHATPTNLLSLAYDIYGHAPQAVVIGIGGESHDFGDAVSPSALEGIKEAVRLCMNPVWWKN
jgi:hydrogenase maturation protease